MPIPQARDVDATRGALGAWLARKLPAAADVAIGEVGLPSGSGFSNETLLIEASWREDGAPVSARLVARVRPTAYAIFPEYDLHRQYRTMELLAPSGVPVPRMRWYEEDASVLGQPFYVMDRVDGVIPADHPPFATSGWLFDAPPDQQRVLARSALAVLADLHRLDWRALGFEFLARPEYGATPFEQQLGYYAMMLRWAAAGRAMPVVDATLAWLQGRRPEDEPAPSLTWGDARIGNMIFRDFRPVAVLDWEMATLGPGEVDLAWWLVLDRYHTEGVGAAPLPGFPSRAEVIAQWEEGVGRRARDLFYYEVWGAFRFALVLIRIADQMTEYGIMPEGSGFERNNPATQMLAKMLELPPPA
ncbi:MAG: phosphotransferase family protein [Deltaproteobacteria bacterium]|nr:phosphotransferase family protein [Deltaproteobacteria bacterium]